MKKFIALIAFAMLLISGCAQQDTPPVNNPPVPNTQDQLSGEQNGAVIPQKNPKTADFREFISKDGRFSILLPASKKEESQSISGITIYLFTASENGLDFTVSYNDYPAIIFQNSDPNTLLEGGKKGALAATFGELKSEKPIDLDGYPGKEFIYTALGQTLKQRIYIVNNRQYSLIVSTGSGSIDSADAVKFLDSFRLIEAEKPPAQAGAAKEFSPSNKRFSVWFPSDPKEGSSDKFSDFGAFNAYSANSSDINYTVALFDYFPELVLNQTTDELLKSAKDGAIMAIQGVSKQEKKIKLGDYNGIEFTAAAGRNTLKGRTYLVNFTLVQLIAITTPEKINSGKITNFLGSFKVNDFEMFLEYCRFLPANEKHVESKMSCYQSLGALYGSQEKCNSLLTVELFNEKNFCNTGVAGKKNSLELCNEISPSEMVGNTSYKDFCISTVAYVNKDAAKCDLILNSEFRDICIDDVAIAIQQG